METIIFLTTNTDITNKDIDIAIHCQNNPVDLIGKVIISTISTFYARN